MTFNSLSYQGDTTIPTGIRGNNITAAYIMPGYTDPNSGLSYNLKSNTWSLFPTAALSFNSIPYGPTQGLLTAGMIHQNGTNVGYYYNSNTGNRHILADPLGMSTVAHSIYGNQIVGAYWPSTKSTWTLPSTAFLYNIRSNTFTSLAVPGYSITQAFGIWGAVIAGTTRNANNPPSGYIYNQNKNTYQIIDAPNSTSTSIHGIGQGSKSGTLEYTGIAVVNGQHEGFAMQIGHLGRQIWELFQAPGATTTSGNSISGNTVVGLAKVGNSYQGYKATFAPLSLNAAGAVSCGHKCQLIEGESISAPAAASGGGAGANAAPFIDEAALLSIYLGR